MSKQLPFLFLLLQTFLYGSKGIDINNINILEQHNLYKQTSYLKPDFTLLCFCTDYDPQNINVNKQLSQSQKNLIEGTLYTQIVMVGTVGVLYLMPESVSKWDKDALSEEPLEKKWVDNVQTGPVWDKDDFAINYIGHPVSGAWYYMMARDYGISPEGSFLYSAFVSTFIWEYGYEAFAEVPSWQDLFSTPIVGSIMGEGFYYLEKEIDKNGGKVFNSKTLGSISYFLLNPMGNIANGLSEFFDIKATLRYEVYQPQYSLQQQRYYISQERPIISRNQEFGVVLNINF
ncbi:MAG: DUF3943 domain-containing protein [Sulfurimonas sp.]